MNTTLTFAGRKLTHVSLERALRGAKIYVKDKGWSTRAREDGILVNLSKVEWCDLSATVRLVLVLEAALRDGLQVKIAMPIGHARGREQACLVEFEEKRWNKSIEGIRNRIERRVSVRDFLRYIEFESAVSCPHLALEKGQLEIIEDYMSRETVLDGSAAEDDDQDPFLELGGSSETIHQPEAIPSHDPTYEHFLPLRWLQTPNLVIIKQELDKLRNFLTGIVAGKRRGILRFDAEALANVIFHELTQNTKDHAEVSHCLIAAWCRKSEQALFIDQYYEQEHSFFNNWIKPNKFPLVDIAVGDSGVGIPASLNEIFSRQSRPWEGVPKDVENPTERVLFWSLGRWSTRNQHEDPLRRGTRGLHRVHRLVKGYAGLLTVRSETCLVGWNHGGHDLQESFHTSGLPRVPGTSISIRLPVVMKAEEAITSPPIEDRMVDFTMAMPLDVTIDGLSNSTQHDLVEKLSTGPDNKHRCVVAIIRSLPDDPEDRKQGLANAFEQLRILTSPGALTVLAPGISPDDLDIHVDSFTQETDEAFQQQKKLEGRSNRRHDIGAFHDYYDITDLFSVIDANLKSLWTGGTAKEVQVLEEMQKTSTSTLTEQDIRRLLPDEDERDDVIKDLRQQRDVFRFDQDGAISLRFNARDVFNYVSHCVSERLKDWLDDPLQIGVSSNGPFLSPSLVYVGKWLSMDRVMNEFGWFWVTDALLTKLRGINFRNGRVERIEQERGRAFPSSKDFSELLHETVEDGPGSIIKQREIFAAAHVPFGFHFAVWALAATCIQTPEYRPERILCDSPALKNGLEQLAAFLGIPGKFTLIPRLSLAGELSDLWDDISNKKVLVYCNLVLSCNSVRQIVEQVIRKGAKPVAIACVYDFRPEKSDSIDVDGLRIPVISLLRFPDLVVEPSDLRSVYYIDSVSGRPETRLSELSRALKYPIGPQEMEEYIKETSALYFNHIVHPATHGSYYHQYDHYTFYLDTDRVLSHEECQSVSRKEIQKHVDAFIKQFPSPEMKSCVFYISNDQVQESRAKQLLSKLNSSINSEPLPLDMAAREFPDEADVRDKNVILVDWHAQTGKTISRLIYLAAVKGAHSVLAIIWLSRMPEEEEHVLRSIDSVRVPTLPTRPDFSTNYNWIESVEIAEAQDRQNISEQKTRTVPVRIVFIGEAKIHAYTERECPVCRQQERVMGESGQVSRLPIQHLREFIAKHMERFRPKELSEIRSAKDSQERDSYGAFLSPQKAVQMFRFRDKLDLATRNTVMRLEVFDYLRSVRQEIEMDSPEPHKAEAIITLLATELPWFKLPPLSFLALRREIASIALQVLKNSSDEATLQRAIIVLRSADKITFANKLPELVEAFVEKPQLLMQLLYDAFTIIDAPYEVRSVLKSLVQSLSEFIVVIESRREKDRTDLQYLSLHASAQAIHVQAVRRSRLLKDEDDTPSQAWLRLKNYVVRELKSAHNPLPAGNYSLFYMNPGVEGTLEKMGRPVASAAFWDESREKWGLSQLLLEENVFALIRQCWDVFLGSYASRFLNPSDIAFLDEVTQEKTSIYLKPLNDLLAKFSGSPPYAGSEDWREFKRLRYYINRIFLEPDSGKWRDGTRESKSGSILYRFLHGCPTDIMRTIKSKTGSEKWTRGLDIKSIESMIERLPVFCHDRLVGELLDELYTNAISHKKADLMGLVSVRIEVRHEHETNRVHLVFQSKGTNPKNRDPKQPGLGGEGLTKLEKALSAYGASLQHGKGNEDWDYSTVVTFAYGGE